MVQLSLQHHPGSGPKFVLQQWKIQTKHAVPVLVGDQLNAATAVSEYASPVNTAPSESWQPE